MTDVLGVCTAWGDGVCVVVPDSGRRPGDDPHRRHRLRQAGAAAASAAAAGLARARPQLHALALWPGPGRPSRSASGCCAAPRRRRTVRGGPTRRWRWVDPGRPLDEAATAVVAWHYEALGRRPMAAVLAGVGRGRACFRGPRLGDLESRGPRHRSRSPGVAEARRALAAPRCPALDARRRRRPRCVGRRGGGGRSRPGTARRPARDARPATGWGSTHRGRARAPTAGTGLAVVAELLELGRPSAARPRRTSRCWDRQHPGAVRLLRAGWASSPTTPTATWPASRRRNGVVLGSGRRRRPDSLR